MNAADFNELSEAEKHHFYKCAQCGEWLICANWTNVLFHETDHKPRPDIQYEIHPRKDHRGVDLISDALPLGALWYGEPNATANAISYAKF